MTGGSFLVSSISIHMALKSPVLLWRLFWSAVLLSVFTGCENDIAIVNLVGGVNNAPTESGKDVEIIYSDSARIKVKVFAPQFDNYSDKNPRQELPKGVKVEFYGDSLKVRTKLTANYGIRYEQEKRVEVKNNVIVVNEKGEELHTEHLIWDEASGEIHTEKYVRILTGGDVLEGNGLRASEDFSWYEILNPVGETEIPVKDTIQ